MKESPSCKYVSIVYDAPTQVLLRKWAQGNGFDLTRGHEGEAQKAESFEFHTTIFYTTSKHSIPDFEKKMSGMVTCVKISMLGEHHDIPALTVDSPDIHALRKHFEEVYNMKDEWPNYHPHISISYGVCPVTIKSVQIPSFPLKIGRLRIEHAI